MATIGALPQLTPDTIDEAVNTRRPTLLDCWADWCRPCHDMQPVIEQATASFTTTRRTRIRAYRIDVDRHEELWQRFDLRVIPTLIVFRNGRELHRILGTRSVDELVGELDAVLA